MPDGILRLERNSFCISETHDAGVLVDARDYYRAFYSSLRRARRYVLIAGWQFDSDVPLLRGEDTALAGGPVELLPFLEDLCEKNPDLEIYLLAWDYSVVYALEREWLQEMIFDGMTTRRLHFQYASDHPVGASHHQKFVIVDGRLAFVGGTDLCRSRWDDRRHSIVNPHRVDPDGERYKPYHEVMAYCTGPTVRRIESLFRERWTSASGEALSLPEPPGDTIVGAFDGAIPIPCRLVGAARTAGAYAESTPVQEIRSLYEDAIGASQRLLYFETQYFTSRVVHEALVARFCDERLPLLDVVIVLPRGGDTKKEEFALGAAQHRVLASLSRVARETGHSLSILHSASSSGVSTFIHSKLLVVDDRFLTIGSANCTNRSFSVDTELNLGWECQGPSDPLHASIARLRANLLSEHAGIPHSTALEGTEGLVARIDDLVNAGSKLRYLPIPDVDRAPEPGFFELAFDPERPLIENPFEDLFQSSRSASR